MLRELSIRDILLIERLDLEFQPGLNVLTGETGAGKSILLDCLGFVLGWRGRADIVRAGATAGEVIAEFDLPDGHAALEVLTEAGIDAEEGLLIRRTTSPDGRKKAWVNDRPCTGETLRRLSSVLVELHGQQDDRGLLDAKGHRDLLDDFGGLAQLRSETRRAWEQFNAARSALVKAEAAQKEAAADQEYLAHAARELDDFGPEAGEDDALDRKRRMMQAAGRIRDDIEKAAVAMGADGAEGRLGDATRWLEAVSDQASGALDGAIAALDRALSELGEAQHEVDGLLADMDFDPFELEKVEERLFALRALARKHNVQPDALPELANGLRARLAALETSGEAIDQLKSEVRKSEEAFRVVAKRLSEGRHNAAKKLDAAMSTELAPLKLERARFSTEVSDLEVDSAGPNGMNEVSFTVSTNPGVPPGPLNRIASGGELSRFLLALKVCLSGRSEGLTLIFDEIDRGVGGATADAVGRRLEQVANDAQVIVVTHSPQVAARGGYHWRVAKAVNDGATLTDVAELDAVARVDEVARMLAGDIVTEEARAAARALLER